VWAIDPVRDVAILHIEPEEVRDAGLIPLNLAEDFFIPRTDDGHGVVFSAGWRDQLQVLSAGERFRSFQFQSGDVLRVSSNAVRPGDSGGPLLNEDGQVLGVVSSGRSWSPDPDVLDAELCLASDLRRANALRAARSSPVSIRSALRNAAVEAPNADVLHVASLMATVRQLDEQRSSVYERVVSAMQQAPDDATLQFLAGSVLQAMGHDERASAAYRSALDGLAEYFPALYALGHIAYQNGDLEQAEILFEQTRQFEPYRQLASLGLARIYTAWLRYDLAEEALQEVLGRDPSYAPALYLLGYGFLARARTSEAEAIAVRLDHVDPAWADALRMQLSSPIIAPPSLEPVPRVTLAVVSTPNSR
ncbi:MAG: trypsin-like serine protease, partial [Rubricoccaceae bacterium]|nr:trypsin-like serine protease [Rubricoccaceae bacterium]